MNHLLPRTLLLAALLAPPPSLAAESAPAAPAAPAAPKLAAGSPAPEFKPIAWIQGEAVGAFEKDKTYILECWATWCNPCMAAIPHVNGLHNKFKDKGVVVIGVDIWEDSADKARAVVQKKGDGMAYRVAFGGGDGGSFSTLWLEPAGVKAIPHTFVVRDNTILWQGHPMDLTESVVASMVEGKFKAGDTVPVTGSGQCKKR